MAEFEKGWYGTDDDRRWFHIGTGDDLVKYIMELGEFEEFAESIIQDDFNNGDSGILCLIEDVIEHTLKNCQICTKEEIYKIFLAEYIASILHDGDYPIYIDRHIGGCYQFRWAECEEDLE